MKLEIFPVSGMGEITEGDNIAELILKAHNDIEDFDVVVVTQKIVSKAEGRIVDVDSKSRLKLAKQESKKILRQRGDLIISETDHGFVCANAGVDFSNVADNKASLLPVDPDKSAQRILKKLESKTHKKLAVLVTDTFGRAWRKGLTNVAIGSAGISPIVSYIGTTDSFGTELHATEMALADELAGAAEMVMGKSDAIPVAIIRGLKQDWFGEGNVASHIIRHPNEDFFR